MFFAQSLRQRKLCREIFSDCTFSYNWIYPVKNVTVARKENDNLDYNNERVLRNFRRELQRPEMNNNSAIIFNFGLHFVESINFANYKKLIDGVGNELDRKYPEVFVSNSTRSTRNRGKAIWKTTTAINKERASNIHLGNKRFLTQQVRNILWWSGTGFSVFFAVTCCLGWCIVISWLAHCSLWLTNLLTDWWDDRPTDWVADQPTDWPTEWVHDRQPV